MPYPVSTRYYQETQIWVEGNCLSLAVAPRTWHSEAPWSYHHVRQVYWGEVLRVLKIHLSQWTLAWLMLESSVTLKEHYLNNWKLWLLDCLSMWEAWESLSCVLCVMGGGRRVVRWICSSASWSLRWCSVSFWLLCLQLFHRVVRFQSLFRFLNMMYRKIKKNQNQTNTLWALYGKFCSKGVLKYPLYFYCSVTRWPYVHHSACDRYSSILNAFVLSICIRS